MVPRIAARALYPNPHPTQPHRAPSTVAQPTHPPPATPLNPAPIAAVTLPGGTLEAVSTRLVQSAIQNAIAEAGGVSAERASIIKITESNTYCDVVGTAGNSSSLPGYDFESGFCVPPACDSSWTTALTLAVNELIYQGAPIAPLSLQCGFTADTGSLLVPIAATCGSLAVVLAVCGFFYVRTHLAESGLDSATLLEGLHEEGGSVSSQDLDEEDTTRLVR